MTPKPDKMLARIEAFNEASGGGVLVRKAANGYSLFREDTGEPVAGLMEIVGDFAVLGLLVFAFFVALAGGRYAPETWKWSSAWTLMTTAR